MASVIGKEAPLIVIVGPTASGKTGLAIDLAIQLNGEIISADSRAIYKGMDIGSAKPTLAERKGIVHWGLDLVEPRERFTAADFKAYALEKIADIRARGKVPFIVGGTGLYVDAIIFDYQFGRDASSKQRERLEKLSLEELHMYCKENNILLPNNDKNKRYVIRAIEQKGINSQRKKQPISNSIIVGIATEKEVLRTRIRARAEQIFDDGVVEEAILLGKKYGWNNEAMTGNIYPLINRYQKGELSLQEVKDIFTTLDWRLAKRQLTWLRRNQFIEWGSIAEVRSHVLRVVARE